jgi:hypothetical protein
MEPITGRCRRIAHYVSNLADRIGYGQVTKVPVDGRSGVFDQI